MSVYDLTELAGFAPTFMHTQMYSRRIDLSQLGAICKILDISPGDVLVLANDS